jgi:transcriptional repressor NrdR
MKCSYCGSDQSKVVDKRSVVGTGEIRRRRECLKCHRRFTTYERVVVAEIVVIKRDGRREPFSHDKLQSGVAKALEKRPSADKACSITDKIESKLRAKGKNEVASAVIGRAVLTELKKIDKVAYLRFASVYRHFDDPADFARELKTLEVLVS